MLVEINGLKVEVLGDPHLGKKFVNGVPLHRRGEREAMVWADFRASLSTLCDVHVTVGDLFDKAVVPFNVILDASLAYRQAAAGNRGTLYVILMGNHDGSRDADFRSAFDVFEALVQGEPHIVVVRDKAYEFGGMGFCPWHPFRASEEIAAELPESVKAVFGHWDVIGFARDSHNYLPVDWIAAHPNVAIYTGHDHKRRIEGRVAVVGSLQPFAHGEDPDDADDPTYVTLTLEEVDGRDLSAKCVRLDLKPGEVPPELDCLQLTTRRISEQGEPEVLDVNFDAFDMEALFRGVLSEAGVPDDIASQVFGRYLDTRLKETE